MQEQYDGGEGGAARRQKTASEFANLLQLAANELLTKESPEAPDARLLQQVRPFPIYAASFEGLFLALMGFCLLFT